MKHNPRPFTVEVRRSGRKPPMTPALLEPKKGVPMPLPVQAVEVPPLNLPKGRILPAIEPVQPAVLVVPHDEPVSAPPHMVLATDAIVDDTFISESEEHEPDVPRDVVKVIRATKRAPAVVRSRIRIKDLPREAFRREERWKHRLPKMIHRRLVKAMP